MKVYPVKCECYDEQMQTMIFTIEAVGECHAKVEIWDVFNGDAWAEISQKVAEALVLMDMGPTKETA